MAFVEFSAIDYLVFLLMMLVSALIGFYYAYKDRNQNNTNEFLLGGRKLNVNF